MEKYKVCIVAGTLGAILGGIGGSYISIGTKLHDKTIIQDVYRQRDEMRLQEMQREMQEQHEQKQTTQTKKQQSISLNLEEEIDEYNAQHPNNPAYVLGNSDAKETMRKTAQAFYDAGKSMAKALDDTLKE